MNWSRGQALPRFGLTKGTQSALDTRSSVHGEVAAHLRRQI